MEKIAGANVYYCDPGSPKQKPLIEKIDFLHNLLKQLQIFVKKDTNIKL